MTVVGARALLLIYAAIVFCFVLTFVGGAFALSVEPDEVWILMSTMKAFGISLAPTSALDYPTRMTCLSMLPAILVWSLLAQRRGAARLLYPLVASVVAVLVFVTFVILYFLAFSGEPWDQFVTVTGLASGMGQSFPGIMLRLNYLVVGDGIIPVLAILALAGWYLSRLGAKEDEPEVARLCGFLLVAGIMGWFAWALKAPIAHIRYLWPAIPLLWLAAILLGLSVLGCVRRERVALITHLVIMGMCLIQGLFNVRMIAVGDSLALVYEAARRSQIGTPRAYFAARKEQETMAGLVGSLPH